MEDAGWWAQLGSDKSRSDSKDIRSARDGRQIQIATDRAADPTGRDLRRGAITARHQSYLGRDRRWLDSSHDGRRRALERCHTKTTEAVAENFNSRRRAL